MDVCLCEVIHNVDGTHTYCCIANEKSKWIQQQKLASHIQQSSTHRIYIRNVHKRIVYIRQSWHPLAHTDKAATARNCLFYMLYASLDIPIYSHVIGYVLLPSLTHSYIIAVWCNAYHTTYGMVVSIVFLAISLSVFGWNVSHLLPRACYIPHAAPCNTNRAEHTFVGISGPSNIVGRHNLPFSSYYYVCHWPAMRCVEYKL